MRHILALELIGAGHEEAIDVERCRGQRAARLSRSLPNCGVDVTSKDWNIAYSEIDRESVKLSGDRMLEHDREKCETIFRPDRALLIR